MEPEYINFMLFATATYVVYCTIVHIRATLAQPLWRWTRQFADTAIDLELDRSDTAHLVSQTYADDREKLIQHDKAISSLEKRVRHLRNEQSLLARRVERKQRLAVQCQSELHHESQSVEDRFHTDFATGQQHDYQKFAAKESRLTSHSGWQRKGTSMRLSAVEDGYNEPALDLYEGIEVIDLTLE